MNKRDAGLQVGRNRLFLIFCFFCIKTKEKHTVFEPFNLRELFQKLHLSLLGKTIKQLKTKTLKKNKTDVITITNHNNARSCFVLQKKGIDVLIGSEFSCYVPDFNVGIHVLTYGFDQEQEIILNKLRKNIYQFLQYTNENDIPTIWAHPLYHYSTQGTP